MANIIYMIISKNYDLDIGNWVSISFKIFLFLNKNINMCIILKVLYIYISIYRTPIFYKDY